MRKTPKFKSGDKVYIKRQSGVAFGHIVRVNIQEVSSYRRSKTDPRKMRLNRKVKISYLVHFDEPVTDLRRKHRTVSSKPGERSSQIVAQSSIKLIPQDESELIRKLFGDDYI